MRCFILTSNKNSAFSGCFEIAVTMWAYKPISCSLDYSDSASPLNSVFSQ
jgi:hypothetical protein